MDRLFTVYWEGSDRPYSAVVKNHLVYWNTVASHTAVGPYFTRIVPSLAAGTLSPFCC